MTNLPISADGVKSTLLIHLGIINISQAPALKTMWAVPSDDAVRGLLMQPGEKSTECSLVHIDQSITNLQAFCLRAATVIAADQIAEVANNGLGASFPMVTPRKIDAWFQGIFKERPDYKALSGMVLQDNVFF